MNSKLKQSLFLQVEDNVPKYKVKFTYTIEGFIEVNASDEEIAREEVFDIINLIRLSLDPDHMPNEDTSIETFDPEIEFEDVVEIL